MGVDFPTENEALKFKGHYLAQAYRSVVVKPRAMLVDACLAAGTTVDTVRARGKAQRAVAARQLVCALLRSGGLSFPAIALLVGYEDHTTVMYGVRRVRARRQVALGVALQRFREVSIMQCSRCGKSSPYIGAQCTGCPPPTRRVVQAVAIPSRKPVWWASGNPWTVPAVIGVVRSLGWCWTWLGSDPREHLRVNL